MGDTSTAFASIEYIRTLTHTQNFYEKKTIPNIENHSINDFRHPTVKSCFFLGAHLHYLKATRKESVWLSIAKKTIFAFLHCVSFMYYENICQQCDDNSKQNFHLFELFLICYKSFSSLMRANEYVCYTIYDCYQVYQSIISPLKYKSSIFKKWREFLIEQKSV